MLRRPFAHVVLACLSAGAVALGCSAPPSDASSTEQGIVFGDDERAPVSDARLRDAVGVLRGGRGECTAFAVGPDRIATAHHCLEGEGARAYTFTSGAGAEARVVAMVRARRELDFAELRVDRTFTRPFAVSVARPGDRVRVVEHDPSTSALVASGACTLGAPIAERSGLVPHRCDTVPGASGGPVLRGDEVVAMHLGFAQSEDANVALDLGALDDPDARIARAGAAVDGETSCSTNCSDACTVGYNYPCPTWKKPGRTCRGHTLDPACKARCEVEREIECRTGLNGCDIWATVPDWQRAKAALSAYGRNNGLTAAKCVDIVQLGGLAAGVGDAAYTAYVEGLKAVLEGITVVGIVAGKAAQHGAECACRKALP